MRTFFMLLALALLPNICTSSAFTSDDYTKYSDNIINDYKNQNFEKIVKNFHFPQNFSEEDKIIFNFEGNKFFTKMSIFFGELTEVKFMGEYNYYAIYRVFLGTSKIPGNNNIPYIKRAYEVNFNNFGNGVIALELVSIDGKIEIQEFLLGIPISSANSYDTMKKAYEILR